MKKVVTIVGISISVLFLNNCKEDTQIFSAECGLPCYQGPHDTALQGICQTGTPVCENGLITVCEGQVLPEIEVCDGLDNDCNGIVDDNLTDSDLYSVCGSYIGECDPGIIICEEGALTCKDQIEPTEEVCDGLDNDCDGIPDNIIPSQLCYDGNWDELLAGECHAGVIQCLEGQEVCTNQQRALPEVCDDLDNDCNGIVDDGLDPIPIDVVFVFDTSGSMGSLHAIIVAATATVVQALPDTYRYAIVVAPEEGIVYPYRPVPAIDLDLTDADTLLQHLPNVPSIVAADEPTYDAIQYLADGTLDISWREDSIKIVVVYSDERGQSFQNPKITQTDAMVACQKANHYVFVMTSNDKGIRDTYRSITTGCGGGLLGFGHTNVLQQNLLNALTQCHHPDP